MGCAGGEGEVAVDERRSTRFVDELSIQSENESRFYLHSVPLREIEARKVREQTRSFLVSGKHLLGSCRAILVGRS